MEGTSPLPGRKLSKKQRRLLLLSSAWVDVHYNGFPLATAARSSRVLILADGATFDLPPEIKMLNSMLSFLALKSMLSMCLKLIVKNARWRYWVHKIKRRHFCTSVSNLKHKVVKNKFKFLNNETLKIKITLYNNWIESPSIRREKKKLKKLKA